MIDVNPMPDDAGNGADEPSPPDLTERRRKLNDAVNVWTGQLVDLGGRNNLLYYKDLKAGTLDLGAADLAALYGALAGKATPLSRLFRDPEQLEDAVRRTRRIHNRAQEHFEERGLETLFIACGLATWTDQPGRPTPAAPVLLCPVSVTPKGAAQDEFGVALTGELEVNPTLLQKLATEFSVSCDAAELVEHADIEGAIDTPEELNTAFRWLESTCASVPGFRVDERFVLGTFSYAKLPMVNDLENSLEALLDHDLIAAIAGDQDAKEKLRGEPGEVNPSDPNHIPPEDEFLILDADSSQNYAINAVLAGRNLIVKGPPGTGKSQTIANLIATLVARQKTVLFVAEKRAAIDAVLSRLEEHDLGDLVLDLHGGGSSRKLLAQGLAQVLESNASTPLPNLEGVHRRLHTRRGELNVRVEALHEPRAPWEISVYDVQARLFGLSPDAQTDIRFRGATLDGLDAQACNQAYENLREYVGLGGLALTQTENPWAGATVVSGEAASDASELVSRLRAQTVPHARRLFVQAATESGMRPGDSVSDWSERVQLWQDVAETRTTFLPEIWERDLEGDLVALGPATGGTVKRAGAVVTSGDYRKTRKLLRTMLIDDGARRPAALHNRCELALACRERWQGLAHDGAPPAVPSELSQVVAAHEQLAAELDRLAGILGREDLAALGGDELDTLLARLSADQTTLTKLPELHRLRGALRAVGLAELLGELEVRRPPLELALEIFGHAWLRSIQEHVQVSDPRIGAFDGEHHRRTVDEFRAADTEHVEGTAARVRRLCAERAVTAEDINPEQAELVRYQARLKRKHWPIRELFAQSSDVLTALKPCWAMSPLVVSQVLPGDRPYFDVVVFDEASQIRPADAIPAIARGRQVVVAGDERQLPPTAFFASSTPESEGDEGDELTVPAIAAGAFESILDALGAIVPFRMLRWHYRSHDERLIAFSNAHLYDKALTTFPGVTGHECLQHVLVPFTAGRVDQEQSVSDEVDEVVKLVLEHARSRPTESLGVIAMGIKHATRIDDALRLALAEESGLEEFFDEARPERFFVKNLERVQGDERDAIILSVGYGKTPEGRLLYRFGPLNQEGGERRLNVAVTRAKRRMTLVSSFGAADMDPNRTSAAGAELLRLYLQYAESRGSDLGRAAATAPELNPFEIDVRDSLTKAGVPLVAQHGCAGYRIDFAAQHPKQPGRFVLAIETDGAAYHSSETARDRDRLRQDQLERLGWRFHRIWSTDWFHHKEREIERTLDAYARAVDDADGGARPPGPDAPKPKGPTSAGAPQRGSKPPFLRFLPVDDYSHATLVSVVRWVESDTLLRTEEQLLAEVMRELGFARRGRKIVTRLQAAIQDVRG